MTFETDRPVKTGKEAQEAPRAPKSLHPKGKERFTELLKKAVTSGGIRTKK